MNDLLKTANFIATVTIFMPFLLIFLAVPTILYWLLCLRPILAEGKIDMRYKLAIYSHVFLIYDLVVAIISFVLIFSFISFPLGFYFIFKDLEIFLGLYEFSKNTFISTFGSYSSYNYSLLLPLCIVFSIPLGLLIFVEGVVNPSDYNYTPKRKLTEFGQKIINETGAEKWINANIDQLVKAIKLKNPKSKLDIQNYAETEIYKRIDCDDFIPFKEYLYENGLSEGVLLVAMGIYLRDKALTKIKTLACPGTKSIV